MKLRACALVALLIGVSGCSLVRGGETGTSRSTLFEQALLASDQQDVAREQQLLATVAAICPVDGLGRRASLLLAAAELDPGNAEGRPQIAARIAALHATRDAGSDGTRPLARSLYLLALDRGATPVADDDVGVFWSAYGLGTLPGQPMRDGAGIPVPVDAGAAEPRSGDDGAPAPLLGDDGIAIDRPGPRCDIPARNPELVLPELPGESLASRLARLESAPRQTQPAEVSADVSALQAEVRQLRSQLDEKEQELARIRRTLRP